MKLSLFLLCATYLTAGALHATTVSNPLRPTDALRIKIQKLTAADIDPGQVYVSARLLLCINAGAKEVCDAIATTEGLQIGANQTKDFEKENSKSMSAVYSNVLKGDVVGQKLSELPSDQNYGTPFFKIELRKNILANGSAPTVVSGGDAVVIGFKRAEFPPLAQTPDNRDNILRERIVMNIIPGTVAYGAEVEVLIQRPK